MSYLKVLKIQFSKHIDLLKENFEKHCQTLIDKKLQFDIEKLRSDLHDNIVEQVLYYKDNNGIIEIDSYKGTVDLSDLFEGHDDLLHIILDNVKNQDIEDYLEELPPFKKLKQSIDKEFDGLSFHLRICVDWKKNSFDRYVIEEISCIPSFIIQWD